MHGILRKNLEKTLLTKTHCECRRKFDLKSELRSKKISKISQVYVKSSHERLNQRLCKLASGLTSDRCRWRFPTRPILKPNRILFKARPESKKLTIWSRITTSSALESAGKLLIGLYSLGCRRLDIFIIEITFETFQAVEKVEEKIEVLKI
jgi:hypothetical protein